MWQDLRKLFKESILYGAGSMSATLIAFLMTPVLTRYLSVEGYGRLSLLNVAIVLATNIFGLGLASAVFNGLLHKKEEQEKRKVQGTTWILLLISIVIFSFSSLVLYKIFIAKLSSIIHPYLFLLLSLTIIGSALNPVFFSVLRAFQKAKQYSQLSVFAAFATFIFTLLFVISLKRNLEGVFEARLLASLFTIFAGIYFTGGVFLRAYDKHEVKSLLTFGLHLVPTGLLAWALELSDRFLIQYYLGAKDVGIYTLGYQYATFLTYPMVAFQMAWPQTLVAYANMEDGKTRAGKIFNVYLAAVFCLSAAMIVFAPEGIRILGGRAFRDSLQVVLPVTVGYIFFGLYLWGTAGNYIMKSTRRMPYITLAGCIVNVAGNILFIPYFGFMASAYATLATFCIMAVSIWFVVRKIYPLKVSWRGIIFRILLFSVFLTAALFLQRGMILYKCAFLVSMAGCFIAAEILLSYREKTKGPTIL